MEDGTAKSLDMPRSKTHHDFQAQTSHKHLERLERARKSEGAESLVLEVRRLLRYVFGMMLTTA